MLVPSRYLIAGLVGSVLLIIVLLVAPPVRFWLASSAVPLGSTFTVTSTGYASSPYQTDATPCITAAGTVVRDGVVAANFLPFGTLIRLDEEVYKDRTFIVEDRTNRRYTHRLDIWFPQTSDALEHGVRTVEVTVVGYGTPGQSLGGPEVEPETDEGKTEEDTFTDPPTLFQRAGLEVAAVTRLLSRYLGANVNRHDVDCSLIVGEALE